MRPVGGKYDVHELRLSAWQGHCIEGAKKIAVAFGKWYVHHALLLSFDHDHSSKPSSRSGNIASAADELEPDTPPPLK